MKTNTILEGDALTKLKEIPDKSINMVMTSPPYWALRDYSVEGQLGLEPTFDEYIKKLCDIFDEIKRVLKDDGTIWINLGDTYSGSSSYSDKGRAGFESKDGNTKEWLDPKLPARKRGREMVDMSKFKDKCLCMIPERFAIEMVNRGWILRNKIIWHKNNAMPSSVLDRFSNKYEIVYMFSKQKKYYFDIDNVRIPYEIKEKRPMGIIRERTYGYDTLYPTIRNFKTKIPEENAESYGSPRARNYRKNTKEGSKRRVMEDEASVFGKRRPPQNEGDYERNSKGKNPGDVWTLNLQPFPGAHFAVYPESICETPIRAGCPEGGVVLDPFFGAGTTGLVALKQGKKFIGIELNPEYIEIAKKRLQPYKEQTKLNFLKAKLCDKNDKEI